tara:strand:- start:623 stop:1003 length:381 start_codon:yes stop_codon:yes gene_type:complete
MSQPYDPTILTRRSTADLHAESWTLVVSSGDDDLAVCGDGLAAIGALTNDVADGSTTAVYLPVQVGGVIKVVCGGVCTAGLMCSSDASGEAVNGTASGDYHFGIALGTYGAGEIGTFLWAPGGQEN